MRIAIFGQKSFIKRGLQRRSWEVKPPVDEGFLSENSNILTAFKKIAGFMELCSNLKIE